MSSQPHIDEVPEQDLQGMLLHFRRENWDGIQTPETQARVVSDILHGDASAPLRRVDPYVRLSEQSRVLDLGSGVGSFVVACKKNGLRCFGVEPDRIGNGAQLTAIQIARRRLAEQVFVAAVGELLPFADESFDLVTMNQVIEHVSDQRAVLREANRVLRLGGVVYIACPNYLRFYEPHYKIFWIPLLPKFLGRLYLRMRGRRSIMIDQITYTTNRRLRRLMKDLGSGYTVLDLHREQFLQKRATGKFTSRKMKCIRVLTQIPLVGTVFLALSLRLVSILEGGCEFVVIKCVRTAS